MPKFNVKFHREFEVEIEADTLENAAAIAKQIVKEIPGGRVLSILPEGYVEPVEASEPEKPTPPRGTPHGGGTPGTPTVSVPVLEDQIAKAA